MRPSSLLFFALLSLFSCDEEEEYSPQPDTVRYAVRFEATWSSSTHPEAYPANAHFSRLIGCAHNSTASLFTDGQPASAGIKAMAELGQAIPLRDELRIKQAGGTVGEIRAGDVGFPSPGLLLDTITVTKTHPFVSYCTMVAPSPDWFAAVRNVLLFQSNNWQDDFTIKADVYDAGTDSGPDFSSPDTVTDPVELVRLITTGPLAVNGTVAPMGFLRFTRIN